MELRSKKTSHCLSLLFAMLPITTLGAADLAFGDRAGALERSKRQGKLTGLLGASA